MKESGKPGMRSHVSDVEGQKGVERPKLRVGSSRYRAHALTTLREDMGTSNLTDRLVRRFIGMYKAS